MTPEKIAFLNDARNAEADFVLARIINEVGTAEGSSLPPRQFGATRIPLVQNFRVLRVNAYNEGTEFTVGFDVPPLIPNISCFRIYTKLQNEPNFSSSTACQGGPAVFRVATPTSQAVTFICQTVLENGFQSRLDESPSCTSRTVDAAPERSSFVTGIAPIQTASFTAGNRTTYPCSNAGGVFTVSLPSAALVPGRVYIFKKVDLLGTAITITPIGGQLIDGAATYVLNVPYASVMIQSDGGTNWYVI